MTVEQNIRVAVLGPGENDPAPNREQNRKGIASRDAQNTTTFRNAERKFKSKLSESDYNSLIHYNIESIKELYPTIRKREISLLDCFNDSNNEYLNFLLPLLQSCSNNHNPVIQIIEFSDIPGLIYIPNPFTLKAIQDMIIYTFQNAINPPNHSNLDPYYDIPIEGWWNMIDKEYNSNQQTWIHRKHSLSESRDSLYEDIQENENIMDRIAPSELIRKLRWVTLGYQYNWTTKEYKWDSSALPFPQFFKTLSSSICYMLGWTNYKPEAGIVNYYQLKDTLTGHVDRSEIDDISPLFSLSLGLDAIFLVGGKTRDDPVLPFRLSNGDIIILSNECRRYYHGVPRIIENSMPNFDNNLNIASKLIDNARLNINIRQVFY